MKVLVNAYGLLSGEKGAGGAGRYLISLLKGLALRSDVELRVICSIFNHAEFRDINGAELCPIVRVDEWVLLNHFEWADVYYCPLNGLSPAFIPSSLPVVVCIHDLQHNVCPQFFTRDVWQGRNKDYGFAIERADLLIAISEFEKKNFQTFFGKHSIEVIHHSGYLSDYYSDEDERKLKLSGKIPLRPYLIYPAVPWPHKNHYRLLQSFYLLRRHFQCDYLLLLTGALEHSLSSDTFIGLVKRLDLQEHVSVKGFLDDRELAVLIKRATAVVFPSLYEGFGIPIVEGMQLGTPVIAANSTAIPEVMAGAGVLFRDVMNPWLMAEDLKNFLNDSILLQNSSNSGIARGKDFSTEKMISLTLHAFRKAIEDKKVKNGRNIVKGLSGYAYSVFPQERVTSILLITRGNCKLIDDDFTVIEAKVKYLSNIGRTAMLVPLELTQHQLSVISQLAADNKTQIAFFESTSEVGIVEGMRMLVNTTMLSEYFALFEVTDNLPEISRIATVISELDLFSDLGGAVFNDTNAIEFSVIARPGSADQSYELYMKNKDKALEYFHRWIIRKSIVNASDVVGTVRFLSYVLKNVSYLISPSGLEETAKTY